MEQYEIALKTLQSLDFFIKKLEKKALLKSIGNLFLAGEQAPFTDISSLVLYMSNITGENKLHLFLPSDFDKVPKELKDFSEKVKGILGKEIEIPFGIIDNLNACKSKSYNLKSFATTVKGYVVKLYPNVLQKFMKECGTINLGLIIFKPGLAGFYTLYANYNCGHRFGAILYDILTGKYPVPKMKTKISYISLLNPETVKDKIKTIEQTLQFLKKEREKFLNFYTKYRHMSALELLIEKLLKAIRSFLKQKTSINKKQQYELSDYELRILFKDIELKEFLLRLQLEYLQTALAYQNKVIKNWETLMKIFIGVAKAEDLRKFAEEFSIKETI